MEKQTKENGRQAAVIFWVLYLAYTSTYIVRLNLSVAKPALEQLGKVDTAQLALLGSVFSLVYAVGRLLNGTLGDWIRPGIMVCTGLLLAAAGNISMGLLPPWWALAVSWGVNAFGQSMLWGPILGMIPAIYEEQEAKRRATIMGTSIAMGNVAGILAASFLVNEFGAVYAFLVPGVFALVLAAAVAVTAGQIRVAVAGKVSPVRQLLRKQIQVMLLPAMIQGVMKDNVSLFMVDYFVKHFRVDPTTNPLYILFIPVSGLAGRMLYPVLYRKLRNNEYAAAAIGFAFCALCALPLGMNLCGASVATLCLCGIYAFVSIINTSFLAIYPLRYADEGTVSSVSGIMDFTTYLGHGISSAIYGAVILGLGYQAMYLSWAMLSALGVALLWRKARP